MLEERPGNYEHFNAQNELIENSCVVLSFRSVPVQRVVSLSSTSAVSVALPRRYHRKSSLFCSKNSERQRSPDLLSGWQRP